MAITKSNVSRKAFAIQANFVTFMNIALDASYPTGGYALSLGTECPNHEILFVHVEPQYPYVFVWKPSASKLVVYKEDGTSGVTAEVANATDLSAVTDLVATIISQ